VFLIKQGFEPPDFIGYFGIWDRDLWSVCVGLSPFCSLVSLLETVRTGNGKAVLATLEISGNFLFLENSGNLICTVGIVLCVRCHVFEM